MNKKTVNLILAILSTFIPSLAFYFGYGNKYFNDITSNILSINSNSVLSILFYFNFIAMIFSLTFFLLWMKNTFKANINFDKALVLSYRSAMPFIFSSLTLLLSNIYVVVFALLLAIGYSVFILYNDIHKVSDIEKETGFVYASAVLTTILVSFVALSGIIVGLITNGYIF